MKLKTGLTIMTAVILTAISIVCSAAVNEVKASESSKDEGSLIYKDVDMSKLPKPMLLYKKSLQCSNEIKWIDDLKEAKKKAVDEKKPLFCYVYIAKRTKYSTYFFRNYLDWFPLMNQGAVAFINSKFIPVRQKASQFLKSGFKSDCRKNLALDGNIFLLKPGSSESVRIVTTNPEILLRGCDQYLLDNSEFNRLSDKGLELAKQAGKKSADSAKLLNLLEIYIKGRDFTKAAELIKNYSKKFSAESEKIKSSFLYKQAALAYLQKNKQALKFIKEAVLLNPEKTDSSMVRMLILQADILSEQWQEKAAGIISVCGIYPFSLLKMPVSIPTLFRFLILKAAESFPA